MARSREHGAVSFLLGLKSPLSLEACLVHRQLGDFQQRLCVLWGGMGPRPGGALPSGFLCLCNNHRCLNAQLVLAQDLHL